MLAHSLHALLAINENSRGSGVVADAAIRQKPLVENLLAALGVK
jgi:hypothetical protein